MRTCVFIKILPISLHQDGTLTSTNLKESDTQEMENQLDSNQNQRGGNGGRPNRGEQDNGGSLIWTTQINLSVTSKWFFHYAPLTNLLFKPLSQTILILFLMVLSFDMNVVVATPYLNMNSNWVQQITSLTTSIISLLDLNMGKEIKSIWQFYIIVSHHLLPPHIQILFSIETIFFIFLPVFLNFLVIMDFILISPIWLRTKVLAKFCS